MSPLPAHPDPAASAAALVALELPADPALLVVACRFVTAYAAASGMAERDCQRLEVAVDEVCSNVILHSYGHDKTRRFRVTAERSDAEGERVVVRVYDTGRPFSLEGVPAPDVGAALGERRIGGLGLFLAKKMVDRLEYERTAGGENCVSLWKRILPEVARATGN